MALETLPTWSLYLLFLMYCLAGGDSSNVFGCVPHALFVLWEKLHLMREAFPKTKSAEQPVAVVQYTYFPMDSGRYFSHTDFFSVVLFC
jgi:hypothetical protein